MGLPTAKQFRIDQYLGSTTVKLDDQAMLTIMRCACGIFSLASRMSKERVMPTDSFKDSGLADAIMTATCLKMLRKKRVPPAVWLAVCDVVMEDMPEFCLLYTSPSPRDATLSRMPSSA